MEIGVRKARIIEQQLGYLVEEEPMKLVVEYSIFADDRPKLDDLAKDAMDEIEKRSLYNDIRYVIRDAISAYNHDSGLSTFMAEEAKLKSMIRLYSKLADITPDKHTDSSIAAELDAVKMRYENAKDTSYSSPKSDVRVHVFSYDDIHQFKIRVSELKKAQSDLAEKMLGLNFTGKISIPDKFVDTLKVLNFL